MSRFVPNGRSDREEFDWGAVELVSSCRASTGAQAIAVLDVKLRRVAATTFHKHPDQEEMIIVKAGEVEQWIEREKQELGPGDSVYIDADVVHASFNDGAEDAQLRSSSARASARGATSWSTSPARSPGPRCGSGRCRRSYSASRAGVGALGRASVPIPSRSRVRSSSSSGRPHSTAATRCPLGASTRSRCR